MKNVSTGDIFRITCLPWEDLLGGMSPLKTFPGEVPSTAFIIPGQDLLVCSFVISWNALQ